MDISPNALRKETVQVLNGINISLEILNQTAEDQGIDPHAATLMAPLLLGKAQCLHTLTLLNDRTKR